MTYESSSQLKSRARETLLGHYSVPMGSLVLIYLCTLLVESAVNLVLPGNIGSSIFSFAALLIMLVFSALFQTGYSCVLLNMARRKSARLHDLLYPFKIMPDHVILLSVRLFLLTLASMLPFLGGMTMLIAMPQLLSMRVVCALLLVVSFFLAMKLALDYSQVFYLYLDHPYLSCREIMQQSKRLMNGNRIRYFYLIISFFGLGLLGILSLGIGLLWIIPYMTMTQAEFYRDLIHEH